MRVGLNATCLNGRPSGARQRFVGIYGELVALASDVEFVVFEPSDCDVASWFGGAANVTARKTPIPSEGRARKFLNGLGYWRSALARERLDVFEGFNLPLVTAPGARNILTIHDLRGLAPVAGFADRWLFRPVLQQALRAADHVVTVSEAMKRALLAVDPGLRVSVIYNGLSQASLATVSPRDLAAFQARFGLGEGYVLAVGHLEARKNYPRLVDAMAVLHARGLTPSLVIIGNDSGEREAVESHVRAAGLVGQVHLLSGLTDQEVRCAYSACGLFVFPSTYEGFGIPIIEAMAAGRPMVLSNIDVFREITQQKGTYFPPADVDAMAEAMAKVLSSGTEQARIIGYGLTRINDFSYRRLAEQVKVLYESNN
ncbi:glycosyltransferase family 1 protein [Arenimonas sp.]|uniref:glycosyltransferase family 4 protein n=1 Tax=Arenimonas sp. TaxID=1872635 RepID=UPI0025BB3622|nr:glycosyltransferase family 1 protein [Arenimonas sp.]